MKLADARDSWLRALRAEGASEATLDIYSSAVDRFLDYQRPRKGPTAVEKIDRAHIEGFLTHLQDARSRRPLTIAIEPFGRSSTSARTATTAAKD
jgi:site-specific recombinase XerD